MAASPSSVSILKSKKATRWTLVAITWVAFLLRLPTLAGQSLWRDEVDAIHFSDWVLPDLLAGLVKEGHNGPLFFVLLRLWRTLTGNSEIALRYPSALMGTLAVPLGYVLARQLGFSRRTGLLLSLLLATSPYLVWYSQEAKMYTLLLVAVSLAFIAYLKALQGQGYRWWLIFVGATSFSFYIHILSPLMLVVYGAVGLLHWAKLRRHWRGWLISMACLTGPYLPLIWWQLPFLVSGADRGHPFYPLGQQFQILLQLYSSGLVRFINLTGIIVFVFLFLSGLFLVNRRAEQEQLTLAKRLTLAFWALLPPLTVYLISLRVPVFEDRYMIYIVPAFYLMTALGLVLVRHHAPWLATLCLGLILTINLMGIWQQQRQPLKADFRAAGRYLASQESRPQVIMVQMPYLRYTLNYYYPHEYKFLGGLWTNNGKTKAQVDAEMSQTMAGLTDVWLVVSEEELWDNRHLVRDWLNQNAHLIDQAHFTRVDLYHYRLQPGSINTPSLTGSNRE